MALRGGNRWARPDVLLELFPVLNQVSRLGQKEGALGWTQIQVLFFVAANISVCLSNTRMAEGTLW